MDSAQTGGLDMTVLDGVQGAVGSTVTYTVIVSNDGTKPVTGAVFSAEPPVGLSITSMTSETSGLICDFIDPSIDICRLNTVPVGSSISIVVTATISAAGAAQPAFSVTPQGRSGQFK